MMDSTDLPLVLGPIVFEGFELPGQIAMGGRQRMAVHRLADGSRVVDVLGPDENDIGWTGILAGPGAAARAQALDALRLRGEPLDLSFGDWFAPVLVTAFSADASLTGWVPYRILCTVTAEPPEPDPVEADLPLLSWPGEPLGIAGLDSGDLAVVLAAAGALAAAAAVRASS